MALYMQFKFGPPGEFIIALSSILFVSRQEKTMEIYMEGRESPITIVFPSTEVAAALYKKIWDGLQAATRDDLS